MAAGRRVVLDMYWIWDEFAKRGVRATLWRRFIKYGPPLLLVTTMLVLATFCVEYALAHESDDHPRDLLPQEEPKPVWQLAVEYWDSLEWFAQGCMEDNLPQIPASHLSRVVLGKGRISYANGHTAIYDLFPRPEYTQTNPDAFFYLHPDYKMTLGLYCFTVNEYVEVKITCWEGYGADCADLTPKYLSPGNSVVIVHPEHGWGKGHYRVEMRCAEEWPCWPGKISAVRFEPPTYAEILRYFRSIGWSG